MTEKELKEYRDFMNNPCNIYISVKTTLQMREGDMKQKIYSHADNTVVGLMFTSQQASMV